jgi:hypothetical protein
VIPQVGHGPGTLGDIGKGVRRSPDPDVGQVVLGLPDPGERLGGDHASSIPKRCLVPRLPVPTPLDVDTRGLGLRHFPAMTVFRWGGQDSNPRHEG